MTPSPIASDLSFECLQKRTREAQLAPQVADSTNRRLHRVSGYRVFIADVDEFGDCAHPQALDAPRCSTLDLSLTPMLPFHAGRER